MEEEEWVSCHCVGVDEPKRSVGEEEWVSCHCGGTVEECGGGRVGVLALWRGGGTVEEI